MMKMMIVIQKIRRKPKMYQSKSCSRKMKISTVVKIKRFKPKQTLLMLFHKIRRKML
jgi:hypothetical protein